MLVKIYLLVLSIEVHIKKIEWSLISVVILLLHFISSLLYLMQI